MKHALWFWLILALTACSYLENGTERPVARVGDEYLYESELANVVPLGTLPADSLVITRNFIDGWVHRRSLILQAKKNLTDEQLDFSAALEDYQNSLIIFAYENMLVNQRLDTVVPDAEIYAYYDQNPSNFLLKDNILRVSWVRLPVDAPERNRIRRLFFSGDSLNLITMADICDKENYLYYLDTGDWIIFEDFVTEVPVPSYSRESLLSYRKTLEFQDSLDMYYVQIGEARIKESLSPLQFEKERIRSIILNKRKMELLHTMRRTIYEEALKNNQIEVY